MAEVFKKALVAVDDSEQAFRAVQKAAELVLAGMLGKVVLLNVYDNSKVDITKLHAQEKLDKLRSASMDLLQKYEKIMSEKGVHPELKKAGGEPSALILDIVENDREFDLIIMGSRRLNKFQELAFGSVSDRVSRLAEIPTLLIK
jgi:nucleotide-binding universal stress UspA family protein